MFRFVMPDPELKRSEQIQLLRAQFETFLYSDALKELFGLLKVDRSTFSQVYNGRRLSGGKVLETQEIEPLAALARHREKIYPLLKELGFLTINKPFESDHSHFVVLGGSLEACYNRTQAALHWMTPSVRYTDGLACYRPIHPRERAGSSLLPPCETEFGAMTESFASVFSLSPEWEDEFQGDRNLNSISCTRVFTADNVEAWGFDFGGVSRRPGEKEKPVVVEINGIRTGFLCFTETMNKDSSCKTEEEAKIKAEAYGIKTLRNADYALEVQKIRDAGAEVVFALPHWGEEYRREPEANTILLAKKLIAAGVDVILGSHPHMVQPVEFLEVETEEGKIRTGLAAYSLGNFISNQSDRYTDSGIILDFTIRRSQKDVISVENVQVIPTYCWRRDDMIQPLCSKKYLNRAPEGMDQNTWLRLKESYEELRELIDEKIPMITY